jgi:hypothetical protein
VQNTKGDIVEELGTLLTEAGMQNVLPLPKARVPVVKFVVGDNGTKVRAALVCSIPPSTPQLSSAAEHCHTCHHEGNVSLIACGPDKVL